MVEHEGWDVVGFGGLVLQEGVTLEVRWVRPGGLPTAMIEWFSPFVEEFETREDTYLVVEDVQGLSVKIRGGERLDIKVARGDRGVLDVPGRVRGRTRYWMKWSFPTALVPGRDVKPRDWVSVRKHRRIGRFSVANGLAAAHGIRPAGDESTCAVEVTEVLKGEEPWWTLGFEAAGHSEALRGTLDATAALLFSNPLPDGVELRRTDSISYSEWLDAPNRAQP
jgi:hypothetical protein